MKQLVKKVMFILIILLMIFSFQLKLKADDQISKAKVIVIYGTENIIENEETKKIQKISVKILEGNYEGEEYDAIYYINSNNPYELKKGSNIYIKINENEGQVIDVSVEGIVRQNVIILFFAISMILYILVFRTKGLKIILSILLSFIIIYFLIIHQIALGSNSLLISFIATILIVCINTILINGVNRKSLIIMISTTIGVILSGGLAFVFSKVAMLSNNLQNSINIELNSLVTYKDLIISSTIIASIGVCLDMTKSIIEQLKIITERFKLKDVLKDIYYQLINKYHSIILICLGIFLTYIITINNLNNLLNNEIIATIATMIISILISITVLVPITILIYIWLNRDIKIYKTKSDNIIDGQRTLKL